MCSRFSASDFNIEIRMGSGDAKSGAEDETIVMHQREKNAGKRKGFFPVVNLRMTQDVIRKKGVTSDVMQANF